MKKLFGMKKKKKETADPKEALQGINNQLGMIQQKIKSLDARVKTAQKNAKEMYKAKNQRGAILEMKKSKMLQKELNKVEGMQLLMLQQKQGLEGSQFDTQVFQALQKGNVAMKEAQKQAGVADFEDLRDDLEEVMADQEDVQQFFQGVADQDNDELQDQLKALMQEDDQEQSLKVQQELDIGNLDLPAAPIHKPDPLPAAPVAMAGTGAGASDEDMLAQLMS